MTDKIAKTLKDALYDAVHRNDKKIPVIAEEIGMGASYLSRACLPDVEEGGSTSGTSFPVKKIIPLVKATGDFGPVDFIENSLGRVAVPIPPAVKCTVRELRDHALKSAAEFGDLMREINESIKDDDLSQNEKEQIIKEGWEAIQSIVQLIKSCED